MKKNYLFFINGQVRTSVKGEKVLKKDSLRNVRKYFTPDYISELMNFLNGIVCRQKKYDQAANHNALIVFDYDDPCQQLPYFTQEALQRPVAKVEEKKLHKIFLTHEAQCLILASKCRVMIDTLIWISQKISTTWQQTFGYVPDVFAKPLNKNM